MPVPNLNDGSTNPPALKVFLNTGTLWDLPPNCSLHSNDLKTQYRAVQEAGFTGLQDGDADAAKAIGLQLTGSGRINRPSEVRPLALNHQDAGFLATTLHVGWGTEYDSEVDSLIKEIIEVSKSLHYPLYVETHRATVTQDNWRTVQIAARLPEIRFNADFSHWYTGHEMVYGDWDEKIEFIKPVLDRVRFIHGRISTPGAIQAPLNVNPHSEYIIHFREIWRRSFEGFLNTAKAGDYILFAPELLPPKIYYAQTTSADNGKPEELSDRWTDALMLKQIAQEEFENAKSHTQPKPSAQLG